MKVISPWIIQQSWTRLWALKINEFFLPDCRPKTSAKQWSSHWAKSHGHSHAECNHREQRGGGSHRGLRRASARSDALRAGWCSVETHQLGIWNKEVVRFLVVLLNGMVSKLFHLSFPASGNFSPSPSAWSTLNRTRPTAVDSCRLCDHQITGRGTWSSWSADSAAQT